MKKTIKRLEIVKSAIELEDQAIVLQQLEHLKQESHDPAIRAIVQAIETGRFSDAMHEIAAWLQNQRALIDWQDPAIAASRLELKALETQLSELIDTRNTRIQILDEFNDQYHLRLGPLMSRILALRQQLAVSARRKQEAERQRREKDYRACQQYLSQAVDRLVQLKQQWTGMNTPSREAVEIRGRMQQQTALLADLLTEIRELENAVFPPDDDAARQAQEKATDEYEQYQEQQQDALHRFARDRRSGGEERHEIKRLWRQASRLCHPDVVADDRKEEAHQIMVQLNLARQNADLATLRSLLAQLQSGLEPMMASDRLNSLEHLQRKIRQLRVQIDALQKEIAALEAENAWQLAASVQDKEAWFAGQERTLSALRDTLEVQVKDVEQELLAG